jgi:hypothetical protein
MWSCTTSSSTICWWKSLRSWSSATTATANVPSWALAKNPFPLSTRLALEPHAASTGAEHNPGPRPLTHTHTVSFHRGPSAKVMALLTLGNRRRTQEATAANATSSRSHAILHLQLRSAPVAREAVSAERVQPSLLKYSLRHFLAHPSPRACVLCKKLSGLQLLHVRPGWLGARCTHTKHRWAEAAEVGSPAGPDTLTRCSSAPDCRSAHGRGAAHQSKPLGPRQLHQRALPPQRPRSVRRQRARTTPPHPTSLK